MVMLGSENMISIPQPPAPTDLTQFKLSSPPISSKSPDRDSSVSPASSPPSLAPSGVSMVSMASMLSRPPSFGFPGIPFPQGFSPKDFSRLSGGGGGPGPGDYGNLMMHNRQYARSPPPMVSPNDPTANDCKIVEYRGEKIAAFMINGKTMLCLPQAFELFLKNLVGGLHTVYTKCKRLEVCPMICNVEQVRVLRGLGAIQPGVNRCKLIADTDFDLLYKDCTTSRNQCYTSPAYKISKINGLNSEHGFEPPMQALRPGRPPKRVLPFPSPSPQDAMLQLNRSPLVTPDSYSRESGGHPMDGGRFPGGPGSSPFPGGHPMAAAGAAHLMSLNNPAALLSRTGMLPGMAGGLGGLPGLPPIPGGHALLESYKQSYGDMIKHLQGLQKSQDDENDDDLEKETERYREERERERQRNGSVLNLSQQSQSDIPEGSSIRGSDSDIGEPEPDIGSEEDMDYNDTGRDTHEKDDKVDRDDKTPAPNNMLQMMNQIRSMIEMTVEKAKEDKNISSQKCDLKEELDKEKESQYAIKRKIEEETKTTDLYVKRFRKERKLRKQLEDQLEMETKKIQALEAALRSLSYETLVQVKENIAREAASREKQKLEAGDHDTDQNGDNSSDNEVSKYPTSTPSTESKLHYTGGHDNGGNPPSYSTSTSNVSLAKLNYNISQMTSSSPPPSTSPRVAPGPISSSNLFNSSLASSLPPSVSTSF